MRRLCLLALVALAVLPARAATTYNWTNTLGGDWSVIANWSPNGIPGYGDVANITAPGTYTVTSFSNSGFTNLNLGASSGTQTLVYGQGGACIMQGTVNSNGVLAVTNGGIQGTLTVAAGGELQLTGASKYLYAFNLVNQGTVTWSGGSLAFGVGTTISNGGLWQITADSSIVNGGGTLPTWVNSGTLRKSSGSAVTTLGGLNFVNLPGGVVDVLAGTLQLAAADTNIFGGSFTATAPGVFKIISGIWTDAGGTASGTGTFQFFGDTLLLRTNSIPGLTLASGDVYITGTFQQAGAITNLTLDGASLRGTNTVGNGTLTINSGAIKEQLTILSGGQLVLASSTGNYLYKATILNQGTVTWTGGSLQTSSTVVSNGGLWQIAGNLNVNNGGGGGTVNWTNAGILRKTTGSGVAQFGDVNFINQSGGLVDAQSGTVRFNGGTLNRLGGTFNAAASSFIELVGGTWTDAGGIATGAGTSRLNGATFNFRTNTIPGLQLINGSVYVTGTNTFQQAGAITNLTLDGVTLGGTNCVGNGILTLNSGSIVGWLTVKTNGLTVLATSGSKTLTGCSLINNGTVLWSGGTSIGTGNTLFSNGGLWQIAGDYSFSYSGGATAVWTNNGTLEKTAGVGLASLASLNFYNQSNGLVQVDSGTLRLNPYTTNTAGTLRLNGGKLDANGILAFSGGMLDGSGTVGANALTGGIISPGQGGPGLMSFASDLNLGSNATLTLDGTGTVPGTGYDQLSVTGTVALANCKLQVAGLPNVVTGTTFVIINNDGSDAVTGTFNGLPENSIPRAGSQLFRISYHGGTGNDVTLTRTSNTNSQPQFSGAILLGNGSIQCAATGAAGLTYTVQANTDLTTTNWNNITTATADGSGNLSFTDPAATNFPARFYRFVWP